MFAFAARGEETGRGPSKPPGRLDGSGDAYKAHQLGPGVTPEPAYSFSAPTCWLR